MVRSKKAQHGSLGENVSGERTRSELALGLREARAYGLKLFFNFF
jgi:hypothetical protein